MAKKNFIVACNAGVATSQAIASKVKRLLEEKGYFNFDIHAVDISSVEYHLRSADAYIAVVPSDEEYQIPKIDGVAFLTGINLENELEKLIQILER